ncbi:M48 family metallopeptidase [Leptothoe kymatousa]|uniref:M48 family metalloprotease n=1 Tax=Leptothoe kymatousa TAU-MAC 1615 TaxID=2364775 RepID=A0ABS5Y3A7_9CYAN|nr:M48 family metallopeptidase [Leptothoe kymatousa]MBT9312305.1 M48 family metalloprotease [Leptothoe kymatousa TAU-MAC 1615]
MGIEKSPEQLIKAGLTAFKQKHYGRAIAIFQGLRQDKAIAMGYRLKAQMGLIRTYEAQGDAAKAKQLCQSLLQSKSQSIRQWGQQTLNRLSVDDISKGPLEQAGHPAGEEMSTASSGFVPLEQPAAMPKASIPKGSVDESPASIDVSSSEELENSSAVFEDKTDLSTGASSSTIEASAEHKSLSKNDELAANGASLFHYQTLNSPQTTQVDAAQTSVQTDGTEDSHEPVVSSLRPETEVAPEQQSPKNGRQRSSDKAPNGPDTWPVGGRLNQLKSLGKIGMGRLWLAQIFTLGLFFWVVRGLVQLVLWGIRSYFQFLDQLLPLHLRLSPLLWEPHTWTVIVGFGVLVLASPWLWGFCLSSGRRLSLQQLQEFSPEAVELFQRFCAKRRWQQPTIDLLPTEIPLIFSYGWCPRYGHLVISQGLLDDLAPDEIAALMIYEMSHWSKWDWVFFSAHGLLLQGLHRAYWFFARWGEARPMLLRAAAGVLSTLSYGVFWLLVKVGATLSRIRVPYRDRTAAEITGNPNGLIRGMAKLARAMEQAITAQGYTPPLLESLELMLPVAATNAISVDHLAWGMLNPLRHGLSIHQGHPPLGDRLYTLGAYARHWRLKPSLDISRFRAGYGKRSLSAQDWSTLILWGGLWSGLCLGFGIALLMWVVGAIAAALNIEFLSWLYRDRSVLLSMPLIVAATVQLLRINLFFPEIASSLPINAAKLENWQKDTQLTPLNSLPLKINGTLTGRPALANWLGQEWRLKTHLGSLKLHYISYGGVLSNFLGPSPWLNQSLQVTGWFRRGHYAWVDIQHLRTEDNQIKTARYPIWSAIVSFVPLVYGVWLLMSGG